MANINMNDKRGQELYLKIIFSLLKERLAIVTHNVLRFSLEFRKLIYKHYLRRSYDFGIKSYQWAQWARAQGPRIFFIFEGPQLAVVK